MMEEIKRRKFIKTTILEIEIIGSIVFKCLECGRKTWVKQTTGGRRYPEICQECGNKEFKESKSWIREIRTTKIDRECQEK